MILVLTGGIGSGKSTAARILTDMYGYPVYDADSAVKRLYVENPGLLGAIEADAGMSFRNDGGEFVPSMMAEYVFGNPGALEKVEQRVFPVLKSDFDSWSQKQGSQVVIFESATILEKEYFRGFGDAVILVDSPVDERIDRALLRDGTTRERIAARVSKQRLMNEISEGSITPEGIYICRNDGSLDELRSRLECLIEEIFDNTKQ